MKFSLIKSTALALVATATYAEKSDVPQLRGALQVSGGQQPVLVADKVKNDENQPAQIAHHSHQHSHHHSHAKKKETTKDVKKIVDEIKDDLKKREKKEHKFFPADNSEMNEATKNRNRKNRNNDWDDSDSYTTWTSRDDNRNFDSSRSYNGKRNGNASQKRQNQRDTRRFKDNPNRSQREEQDERNRKSRQARRSGNDCRDPSQPGCGGNDNFPRNREAKRNANCRRNDEGCNYHRVSPSNEPNRDRRNRDRDCLDDCYRRTRNERQERACDRTCAMDSFFAISEFKDD